MDRQGLTHDLREPLLSAAGFVELLAADSLTPQQRHYVDGALEALRKAHVLVEKLRGSAAAASPVCLDQVLAEVMLELEPLRVQTDAVVSWSVLPEVRGDAQGLARVFRNLMANAMRHGGAPPCVRVEARREAEAWHLVVADQGPGVPTHLLEGSFKARPDHDGHGVGLHVVQRIVRAHGGRIWVENDGGATFHVRLPDSDDVVEGDVRLANVHEPSWPSGPFTAARVE